MANSVRALSQAEATAKLQRLHRLLSNLPSSLPLDAGNYNFIGYQPDKEKVEDWGSAGAVVNRDLEVAMCPLGRDPEKEGNGIVFRERGRNLEAVVDMLKTHREDAAMSMVMEKWIDDLTSAAIYAGAKDTSADSVTNTGHKRKSSTDQPSVEGSNAPSNKKVLTKSKAHPLRQSKLSLGAPALAVGTELSDGNEGSALQPSSGGGRDLEEVEEGESEASAGTSVMYMYEDVPKADEVSEVGRTPDTFVRGLVRACYILKDKAPRKIKFRCVAAPNGCTYNLTHRARDRILKHAAKCAKLPAETKQKANEQLAEESLSSQIDESKKKKGKSTVKKAASPPHHEQNSPTQPAQATAPSPGLVPQKFASLREQALAGGRLKKKEEETMRKLVLDHNVLIWLCVDGIPPSKLDSPWFRKIWEGTYLGYQPASSTTFVDKYLPREAATVVQNIKELLKSHRNLTISFDGGTTRGQDSVYTIHVTTPDGDSFLIEGHSASTESHTGEHISKALKAVINEIGAYLFSSISSDNTGNTSVARELVQQMWPWILILPDPCHRLNRLCGDIADMAIFKPVISRIRRVLKFFKKSTMAAARLRDVRFQMGITRGLVSIGNTRFGTLYHAGASVRRCLPAIRELVDKKLVKIPTVEKYFGTTTASKQFEVEIDSFLMILEPIARSITALESSLTTAADVYLFGLAITAAIHQIIIEDRAALPTQVYEEIRHAVNVRFDQLVGGDQSDHMYLTCFLLSPEHRDAHIVKDLKKSSLNPLTLNRLVLRPSTTTAVNATNASPSTPELPETLRRVGRFLLKVLRHEYENRHITIGSLTITEANRRLKELIPVYFAGSYPFNLPLAGRTPKAWWSVLDQDPTQAAQPLAHLAVMLFSITVTSMSEERTMSTFTRFNSALRNRQNVDTLVRMTQVRQWALYIERDKTAPRKPPVVKFRDMKSTLAGTGTRSSASQSVADDFDGDSSDADNEGDTGNEEAAGTLDTESEQDPEALPPGEGANTFTIEANVDLGNPHLLDVLADKPVQPVHKSPPVKSADAEHPQQPKIQLTDADWEM